MVPDWSSTFVNRKFERVDVVDANHMNMCKFTGTDDNGYEKFKGALQRNLRSLTRRDERGEDDLEGS